MPFSGLCTQWYFFPGHNHHLHQVQQNTSNWSLSIIWENFWKKKTQTRGRLGQFCDGIQDQLLATHPIAEGRRQDLSNEGVQMWMGVSTNFGEIGQKHHLWSNSDDPAEKHKENAHTHTFSLGLLKSDVALNSERNMGCDTDRLPQPLCPHQAIPQWIIVIF